MEQETTHHTSVKAPVEQIHITYQSRGGTRDHTPHTGQGVEPDSTHHTSVRRWNQTSPADTITTTAQATVAATTVATVAETAVAAATAAETNNNNS